MWIGKESETSEGYLTDFSLKPGSEMKLADGKIPDISQPVSTHISPVTGELSSVNSKVKPDFHSRSSLAAGKIFGRLVLQAKPSL